MKVLFEAIYNHFSTDPLAALLTELYNTEAPADAVFPYGVFSLLSNIPGDGEFSADWEDCLVQFNLFSDKTLATEVCEAFELLKGDTVVGTGFDFLDLPITDYESISLVREPANLVRVEKVWQYNVTYRMLLKKTEEAARGLTVGMFNLLSYF